MRHLWSLLAGLLAAPLAWLLLATGQHRSQEVVGDGSFASADLAGPVVLLVVAGALLGVLGTLRWSPAGPIAAGLLLVLPTLLLFGNPSGTLSAFSHPEESRLLGQSLALWLPLENGTLLVLGSLLLIATFSLQRWRRWPTTLPPPIPLATDDEVVAGVTALSRGTPSPPMTDDDILAAAAAYDEQTTTTGEWPPPATDRDQERGDPSY